MRNLLMRTLGLTAAAVMYSHAIFGIGGQWAPSPGFEIKKSNDTVAQGGGHHFIIDEKGGTGLNGFGAKIWIDALPFVDIEAGSNIQWGTYNLDITGPASASGDTTIPVTFNLKVPLVPNNPVFARIVSDVSVVYPFLKLPPLVSIVKLYAGAGISHVLSTKVLDAAFAKKALTDANFDPASATPDQAGAIIGKAVVNDGLSSGIGFHLIAGAKAKLPVIPIAVFANVKYGFGGSLPKSVDASSLTFELGGGLAF